MSNEIAFLTTLFPIEEEYIYDFFESLDNQTYKKFDLIVVNDNYKHLDKLKKQFSKLEIIELDYSNTPLKNKEFGINYILKQKYKYLIFGDIDDYFDSNRIEISINKLQHNDIVINDLTLFNKEGTLYSNYLSNRIENNFEFDLSYILDKNICGLSNSAVKLNDLKPFEFNESLIALDWYLFSVLLIKGYKAVFTNETTTFYRQHSNNTIGIHNLNKEKIDKITSVKTQHYSLLKDESAQVLEYFNKLNNNYYLFQERSLEFPLWWEEIELKDNYEDSNQ